MRHGHFIFCFLASISLAVSVAGVGVGPLWDGPQGLQNLGGFFAWFWAWMIFVIALIACFRPKKASEAVKLTAWRHLTRPLFFALVIVSAAAGKTIMSAMMAIALLLLAALKYGRSLAARS